MLQKIVLLKGIKIGLLWRNGESQPFWSVHFERVAKDRLGVVTSSSKSICFHQKASVSLTKDVAQNVRNFIFLTTNHFSLSVFITCPTATATSFSGSQCLLDRMFNVYQKWRLYALIKINENWTKQNRSGNGYTAGSVPIKTRINKKKRKNKWNIEL